MIARSVMIGLACLGLQMAHAYDEPHDAPEKLVYVDADVFLMQLDSQLQRGGDYEVVFVGGAVNANNLPSRINELFTRVRDAGGDIRIRVASTPEVRDRGVDSITGGVSDLSRAVDGLEQLLTTRDRVSRMMRGNPYKGYHIELDVDAADASVVRLLLVRDEE
ncbi:hypothetical protein [Isoalcanivorax indicus]|uniref:hypothetical protein n=1 Tax=Isoalcanivorax indicus TaxID=2202653 RepID=UPI0013C4E329|nr:hypothetical protein [Isoalcanivorax indicus]